MQLQTHGDYDRCSVLTGTDSDAGTGWTAAGAATAALGFLNKILVLLSLLELSYSQGH